MSGLTREQIQERRPAPTPFEVEGWGGTVYVRKVPLRLRLSLYDDLDESGNRGFTADEVLALVVRCVVDESGNQLFEDTDREWLEADFPEELSAVFAEILKVNGWTAEALEAAEKN